MAFAAKLDEYGRPAWIAVTVLGFAVWWPLGLATLAYAVASGRLLRGMRGKFERWLPMVTGVAAGVRLADSRPARRQSRL